VADNFKYGADKNIIVALEHNVLMASKKDLAKVGDLSTSPNVKANSLLTGNPEFSFNAHTEAPPVP
jgi:hypothetical protein